MIELCLKKYPTKRRPANGALKQLLRSTAAAQNKFLKECCMIVESNLPDNSILL